jgi:hypothetical protein
MTDSLVRTKRFAGALDWVLISLLVVEGLLFLSDQYDCFAFNRHKGWTVLIAVAIVAGASLLMGLWAAVTWTMSRWIKLRPFQFGLRSGMLVVGVVGLVCGWLGSSLRQARQQAEICAAIREAGGGVSHEDYWQVLEMPKWLTDSLGVDFFSNVSEASALNDVQVLQILHHFPEIEGLQLDGWVANDAESTGTMDVSLSGTVLRQIQKFPRLKRLSLDVDACPASEILAANFPDTLEELSLDGESLDDTLLAKFCKLPNLQQLHISLDVWSFSSGGLNRPTIGITDSGLQHLSGLAKLRELSIQHSQIDGSGFQHLSELANLETLDISYNKIAEENLKHLQRLRSLKRLNLNFNDVDDAGMAHVAQLSNLESLSLQGAEATSKGYLHLKKLKRLKSLEMWFKGLDTPDPDLVAAIAALEQLQHLEVWAMEMDDVWPQFRSLKQLKTLRFGPSSINSAGIKTLKDALPNCDIRQY